ncbi:MAG: Rrf2 family transcriptional regulator [Candidatus Eisenbacteria bacterium]|uniref:Rrf2 family transcriptional regulator n=1 Tax=Eiseniibacteriota bacterium TaxID=2212470 RepID=A0A956LVV0_UNCEI|nr:Rrf2 family transcriptional regulator [Candidatus Eisenbacteria bacterium]
MYSRPTEAAIAVMSRLAEAYDGSEQKLSAGELSSSRQLPKPFVAKVLSSLSAAGLVSSMRGPGGGFSLARPPDQITLWEVVSIFERNRTPKCPVGGGICGGGQTCPIHDKLAGIREATDRLLRETTFAAFYVNGAGSIHTSKS